MIEILLLLLLMSPLSPSIPIGEKRTGEDISTDEAKRAKILPIDTELNLETRKCKFKSPQSIEMRNRPEKSQISEKCSGNDLKLSEFAKSPVTNARNLLELLQVRGEGRFDNYGDPAVISRYEDEHICEGHLDELGLKWDHPIYPHFFRNKNKQPTCSWPVHDTKRTVVKKLLKPSSSVSVEESQAILKYEGFLVHVGIPVCLQHKRHAQKLAERMKREEQINDELDSSHLADLQSPALDGQALDGTNSRSCQDLDQDMGTCNENPSHEDAVDAFPVHKGELVSAFRSFATLAGETRLTKKTDEPYGELKPRTKQKKIGAMRRLVDVMTQITRHNEWKEVRSQVCPATDDIYSSRRSHHKFAPVMETIVERFWKASTRHEKELVISVIALGMPLPELRKFIPGLSERLFRKAKRIANVGTAPETVKFMRLRFNPVKLQHFVSFITSPEIFSEMAFGEKTVTLSDGTKFIIANTLRLQRASEVVHMYQKFMKERNLEHLLFSRSTLFKILSYCAATQRKASVCVDYFYAEAELAFDDLEKTTKFILKHQIKSNAWTDSIDAKLKESRYYLKGDFRLHNKNGSRVADHCFLHALSDPDLPEFSLSCSSPLLPDSQKHIHDLKCGRCEMVDDVLAEIKKALTHHQKVLNAKKSKSATEKALLVELVDQLAIVQLAEERIIDYKKHQLRSSFTYKVQEEILDKLEVGHALIIADFGQKFLPMRFKERQTDYFGKRGISFHVFHIITVMADGRLAQHTIIHIIENDRQDSVAVTQLISHLFEELTAVKISVVHLRSDNAGAYHSGATLSSIHFIAETMGIRVASYSFSESQNGKSYADRGSGLVKNKVRASVNSGIDAHNHETFFAAATSGRLIAATSIYLVSVESKAVSKNKIVKVSELGHFEFEKGGIRAWKHKDIGMGTFIRGSSFKDKGNGGKLDVKKRGGFYPRGDGTAVGYWRITPASNAAACQMADGADDIPIESDEDLENKIFHCPVITCSASFNSKDQLENHLLRNDHCSAALQYSMRDMSLRLFSGGIEGAHARRIVIPEVDEAIQEDITGEVDQASLIDQGYALKKKKASSRYSEKAKEFVEELFDEGITTGTKVPADAAEKRMREKLNPDGTRMFIPEERLNARQIDSYYSRIKAERTKKNDKKCTRPKRSDDGMDECENDNEEIEEGEDMEGNEKFDIDEGAFEDEHFKSDADLIEESIMNNLNEIFNMTLPIEIMKEELTGTSESILAESQDSIDEDSEVMKLSRKYGIMVENKNSIAIATEGRQMIQDESRKLGIQKEIKSSDDVDGSSESRRLGIQKEITNSGEASSEKLNMIREDSILALPSEETKQRRIRAHRIYAERHDNVDDSMDE